MWLLAEVGHVGETGPVSALVALEGHVPQGLPCCLSVEETRTQQGGGLQVWGLGVLDVVPRCPVLLVLVPLVGPFVDPG